MSERPGTIRADIAVDLPRPRNAGTVKLRRFQEIKNHIRDIIFIRAQA
jgi:NitT/TauT family transport system ATP-binding protein